MAVLRTGGPAADQIIDRKYETGYLVAGTGSARINHNIAVLGHRRIGKTTILNRVVHELSGRDIVTVYFDVKKNMGEPGMFLTRLQKHIFDAYAKKLGTRIRAKTDRAAEIFLDIRDALSSKRIKSVGVKLGMDGTIMPEISFGDNAARYGTLFHSVFNTATILSEKSRVRFVIILDEFQDLERLKGYPDLRDIFDMFRSVIQERGDNVSFIVSGSRVHMLKSMLGDPESALFTHFNMLEVGELDEKSSIQLFNRNLRARKKPRNDRVARDAYNTVGGHPLYLVFLAELWDGKQDISEVIEGQIRNPVGIFSIYCEYLLSEEYGTVISGPLSRTILRSLSRHGAMSYSELARDIMRPMTGLPKYVNALIAADLVVREGGRLATRDRILRRYLAAEAEDLL